MRNSKTLTIRTLIEIVDQGRHYSTSIRNSITTYPSLLNMLSIINATYEPVGLCCLHQQQITFLSIFLAIVPEQKVTEGFLKNCNFMRRFYLSGNLQALTIVFLSLSEVSSGFCTYG